MRRDNKFIIFKTQKKSILSESPRASQGDCASTDGPIRMITQGTLIFDLRNVLIFEIYLFRF